MIIGIDGHMIGDHSGGNESHYTNLLRAMAVDPSDTVYLFVKKNAIVSEFESKFIIVRFKSDSAFIRNFFELNRLCKEYKLDVLHTQYWIPIIRSCKVVCAIHDICFEHYKNIFTKKEYIRQKLLIPYSAKHSEYIFTLSEHAKKDIVDHYHVNPDKVIITNCAVNGNFKVLTKEDVDETDIRIKYDIGNEPIVLSVGNLQPRKNLPRLIEAFSNWKKESKSTAKLVIVGKKAWMYSDILSAAGADLNNIILTDYVSEEDLICLYNISTCFIYPSFFEGFGLPPLEAMACGTPVAVANATSLPEVVGDAGIYFDPFDVQSIQNAISVLMEDSVLRSELSKKGIERNKLFSWEKSAQIIYCTYKKTDY